MPGATRAAASSYAGAIILHGPHHDAQKSTTVGASPVTWRSKSEPDSANGRPGKSGALQLPHVAPSPRRSRATRFVVAHCGQATRRLPGDEVSLTRGAARAEEVRAWATV